MTAVLPRVKPTVMTAVSILNRPCPLAARQLQGPQRRHGVQRPRHCRLSMVRRCLPMVCIPCTRGGALGGGCPRDECAESTPPARCRCLSQLARKRLIRGIRAQVVHAIRARVLTVLEENGARLGPTAQLALQRGVERHARRHAGAYTGPHFQLELSTFC